MGAFLITLATIVFLGVWFCLGNWIDEYFGGKGHSIWVYLTTAMGVTLMWIAFITWLGAP